MSERRYITLEARQLSGEHRGREISIPMYQGQDPTDMNGRLTLGTILSVYHGSSGDTEVVLKRYPTHTHTLAPDWPVAVHTAASPPEYRPTAEGLARARRIATGNV